MNLFQNWSEALNPLLERYKERKHPLEYHNRYQLLVMVILSAQDSDANINTVAKTFFKKYPNINSITLSTAEEISFYLSSVQNYIIKSQWIYENALLIKKDSNIPYEMNDLIQLKGIGRKSANVIMRESKSSPKGIIVDLHVIRVAPRIGIVPELKDGNKIEKILMSSLSENIWGEIGMSISFLGREICRPTNPKCNICPINKTCLYYNSKI